SVKTEAAVESKAPVKPEPAAAEVVEVVDSHVGPIAGEVTAATERRAAASDGGSADPGTAAEIAMIGHERTAGAPCAAETGAGEVAPRANIAAADAAVIGEERAAAHATRAADVRAANAGRAAETAAHCAAAMVSEE